MVKKIHYCWFGGNKPESVKRNVEHWARLNPDFEICEWNELNADVSHYGLGRRAAESGKWAFAADIVRLEKLVEEGGFYLDSDVELLRPLSAGGDKLELGYMYDCALGTAVMYAPPAHPYLRDILYSYRHLCPDKWTVNNTIFTAYFINRVPGFLLNGRAWENEYCRLYPKEIFEQPSFIRSQGVSIHHCCGSWKKEFNRGFGYEQQVSVFSHLLKWASRKRRTWQAARSNEFTPCYRAALRGEHLSFDISGIYTVKNPYS